MPDQSRISTERLPEGQPSRDIEAAVLKLWDLIHNIIEDSKNLRRLNAEIEASYIDITQGIDKQETNLNYLRKKPTTRSKT